MKIVLNPNTTPFVARPRRYTPEGRMFMERYVKRLIEYGFAIMCTQAEWAAPPVIVPDNGPATLMLTFYYRPINSATQPTVWPMSQIESELSELNSRKLFSTINLVSGYWQLPLEESLQQLIGVNHPMLH